MKRTRKIKLTTHRRLLALPLGVLRARCAICSREVEMLSTASAAAILEVDAPTLTHLITEGVIHATPTVSGSLLICQESLFPHRSE